MNITYNILKYNYQHYLLYLLSSSQFKNNKDAWYTVLSDMIYLKIIQKLQSRIK